MKKNLVIQKKSLRIRNRSLGVSGMTQMSKQERIRKIRIFFVWVSFGLFLGIGVYLFLFSPFTKIQKVNIQADSHTLSQADILLAVDEYMGEKQWYVFSQTSFFFFSDEKLSRVLDEKFLTLTNIRVQKKFPDSVQISFLERNPVAYWCSRQRCFALDASGYAFEEIADFPHIEGDTEKKYPVIIDDYYGDEALLRDTVIDPKILGQYRELDDFLRIRIGDRYSATYFAQPPNFEEYQVRTEKNWNLQIAKDIPLEETMRSLFAFLESISPERRMNLESLDLRIEGKIFFTEKKTDEGDESHAIEEGGEKKQSIDENVQSEKIKEEKKKEKSN